MVAMFGLDLRSVDEGRTCAAASAFVIARVHSHCDRRHERHIIAMYRIQLSECSRSGEYDSEEPLLKTPLTEEARLAATGQPYRLQACAKRQQLPKSSMKF